MSFDYPARAWAALVFLGLVCSALVFGAQTWTQQRTPPSRTALILALEPLFAAGVSVAVGMERLGAWEWLGGGLVVAGVVIGGRSRLADTLPKQLI
jgi:drug/metabolite transporter (DMT)-like permease